MENKPCILIIDDDTTLLDMASDMLQSEYSVSCALSGQDAFSLLEGDYLPDIILLDIDMPEKNGFETLSVLKSMEDVQDIPVIFLTGRTQSESELKGLSSGAVDYITKPFVKDILLARIRVHLENGRRLRQLSMLEKKEQNGGIDEKSFRKATADLTETERKVFRLILLGYTNQEIGQELNYSTGYIKNIARIIYEKKGVSKRNELINIFIEQ